MRSGWRSIMTWVHFRTTTGNHFTMISRRHNDWKSIYDDLAAAQVAAAADPVVRPKPATGDALPTPSPPPASLPGTNANEAHLSRARSTVRQVSQPNNPPN